VSDTYFGRTVIDPYRWMESDSPEFKQWMKSQAAYSQRALDRIPLKREMLERVHALHSEAGDELSTLVSEAPRRQALLPEAQRRTRGFQAVRS
jgi:protease II